MSITTSWRRALVTGASSGIGAAVARRLAAAGVDLVLVARRRDRLDALARELTERHRVEVRPMPGDLLNRDDLQAVERRLASRDQPIDLLVNNAGFGGAGRFWELDAAREEAMVRLNAVAVHRLTHAATAAMVGRGRGTVLNVSSNSGFQPVPYGSTYAATKAFVTHLSLGLAEELRGTGVNVTVLCPGFVPTEFQEAAGVDRSMVPRWLWSDADTVAREGLAAARRGRALVVPGTLTRAGATLGRLAPLGLTRRAVGALARRQLNRPQD